MMVLAGLWLATTAFGAPDIEPVPATCDFGVVEVGSTATALIELKNVGDTVLRLDDILLTGENAADFQITSYLYLPVFYGAGGSFYVEVTYTASAVGNSEAALRILSSDPDEATVDIPLLGQIPASQEDEEPADPAAQIAAIIEFFDQAAEAGELEGVAPFGCKDKYPCKGKEKHFCKGKGFHGQKYWKEDVHLKAFRQQLVAAQKFIDMGWNRWAAWQLQALYLKIDGLPRPPDFVEGPATAQLAEQIKQLKETLKQE
jgi:hypothetical protein